MHANMDSPTWSRRGLLLSLASVLFLGSNYCEAQGQNVFDFRQLTMFDGDTGDFLYIEEGAIVDIICKEYRPTIGLADASNSDYAVLWNLGYFPYIFDARVDHDEFPAEMNWEAYASYLVYDSNSIFPELNKAVSTIHYTARLEDNMKSLACIPTYMGILNHAGGTFVYLIVRPGPAPLTFESTNLRSWSGGFLGEINIPIADFYNSWKIILTFRRKVYNLRGSHFQVANEPCLHERNCGEDAKKTWVIYNTFSNHVLNPGDDLHLVFMAETWKKISRGLTAEIEFYGYQGVYMSEISPEISSSDIHVNLE